MDEATELAVDDVPEVEDIEGTTEELDTAEPDTEAEEGDEDSAGEDEIEFVELDVNGKLHRIPAELKDEFMLRADYTRKTQEVAEQRKALESRITEIAQVSDAEVNANATMLAIDAALQQYADVDWEALERQNIHEAQRHFRQFTLLQHQRGTAEQELRDAQASREAEVQRFNAERFEQSMAELRRDIPDWGEAKAAELSQFAQKQFGFTDEDFRAGMLDPRAIKMLNVAFAALKSQPKPKPPAEALKPAAKVKGGTVPRKPLDDRLSADEWVKQRNEQLARRK